MRYFTINELTQSGMAAAKGISNTPTPDISANLTALVDKVLDVVRARWGGPIRINSGYRCEMLNTAVGGVKTSQHVRGEAADITAGSPVENKRLFDLIVRLRNEGAIQFDQLIDEKNLTWIHISYKRVGVNRNQIMKL
jgi:uncharacterized protein YcbK (DUF882 family)